MCQETGTVNLTGPLEGHAAAAAAAYKGTEPKGPRVNVG